MTTQAKAAFSVTSWDEKTWDGKPQSEVPGRKITRAEVTYTYTGQLEGEATMQYLMTYNEDGTGNFVGLEKVTGSVDGKSGSFVLQHVGTFDEKGVWATLTVAPGSGTDELAGLSGKAKVELVGHQESYPVTFDYDLE